MYSSADRRWEGSFLIMWRTKSFIQEKWMTTLHCSPISMVSWTCNIVYSTSLYLFSPNWMLFAPLNKQNISPSLEFTQIRLCFCSAEIKRKIHQSWIYPLKKGGERGENNTGGDYSLYISSDVNLHIPVLYIDLYPDLPWCSCHQFFPGLSMDCTLHFCRPVTERNQREVCLP